MVILINVISQIAIFNLQYIIEATKPAKAMRQNVSSNQWVTPF